MKSLCVIPVKVSILYLSFAPLSSLTILTFLPVPTVSVVSSPSSNITTKPVELLLVKALIAAISTVSPGTMTTISSVLNLVLSLKPRSSFFIGNCFIVVLLEVKSATATLLFCFFDVAPVPDPEEISVLIAAKASL